MKNKIGAVGLILFMGTALYGQSQDQSTTQVGQELTEKLQKLEEDSRVWAEKMQRRLDKVAGGEEKMSQQEWEELGQKIDNRTREIERSLDAWARKMECWSEENGPRLEAAGAHFTNGMEAWAESFSLQMEKLARDLSESVEHWENEESP